jgi:DnaJ-class molecular chaperone
MENYYSILGVDPSASTDIIKKRYRELAKELHPDVNPSKEAEERFKKINAVHETLSNPQLRKKYDSLLSKNANSFEKTTDQKWNPLVVVLAVVSLITVIVVMYMSKKRTSYSI